MLNRIGLVWLVLLKHYKLFPVQAIFLLFGLSLGVAVFLGTLILGASAKLAFNQANEVAGQVVVARILPLNNSTLLPESLYQNLRKKGITKIVPIVEGSIKVAIKKAEVSDKINKNQGAKNHAAKNHAAKKKDAQIEEKGKYIAIKGVDLFPLLNTEHKGKGVNLQSNSEPFSLFRFSFSPYLAVLPFDYAKLIDIEEGDELYSPGGEKLPDIWIASNTDNNTGNNNEWNSYHLWLDIKYAQKLLDLEGRLSSIEITQASPAELQKIQNEIEGSARLVELDQVSTPASFSNAFMLNLKTVGFIALLVGSFIAFNAARFSLLSRVQVIKQVRLLGVSSKEVFWALLCEFVFWALAASICGCVLGWFIAESLLPSIGMTLDQVFAQSAALNIRPMYEYWLLSLCISLLACGVALFRPMMLLFRQSPINSENENGASAGLVYALAIVLVLASGLIYILTPFVFPRSQIVALIIISSFTVGSVLLSPLVNFYLIRLLAKLRKIERYPSIQWALEDNHWDRTAIYSAMVAYSLGLAACIAVTLMVASFRQAFSDYLDHSLSESLYFDLEREKVDPIWSALKTREDVEYQYFYYSEQGQVNDQIIDIVAVGNHFMRHNSYRFESGILPSKTDRSDVASLWQKLHKREGIIINQALALSTSLSVGKVLTLNINGKVISSEILGVYHSYGSVGPSLRMDEAWMKELFPKLSSTRIGVFLQNDETKTKSIKHGEAVFMSSSDQLLADLMERHMLTDLEFVRPVELKRYANNAFEQAFKACQLLSFNILLISALGICCAFYIVQRYKVRQYMLLHVLGINKRKVVVLANFQVLINVALITLIAMPIGVIIALMAIHVVLRFSFGWYFDLHIHYPTLFGLSFSGILIVLLGSIVPAYMSLRHWDIGALSKEEGIR